MRKSKTTKVTLRFRMLNTGKETLYLDYYPGIPNPKTGETMRREYLGMYVVPLKKRNGELQTNKDGSHKYSEADEETIRLAFASPVEVLHHLKATGVTATGNRLWTKGRLEQFRKQYIEQFSTPDGCVTLTYRPVYFVAIKK